MLPVLPRPLFGVPEAQPQQSGDVALRRLRELVGRRHCYALLRQEGPVQEEGTGHRKEGTVIKYRPQCRGISQKKFKKIGISEEQQLNFLKYFHKDKKKKKM